MRENDQLLRRARGADVRFLRSSTFASLCLRARTGSTTDAGLADHARYRSAAYPTSQVRWSQ